MTSSGWHSSRDFFRFVFIVAITMVCSVSPVFGDPGEWLPLKKNLISAMKKHPAVTEMRSALAKFQKKVEPLGKKMVLESERRSEVLSQTTQRLVAVHEPPFAESDAINDDFFTDESAQAKRAIAMLRREYEDSRKDAESIWVHMKTLFSIGLRNRENIFLREPEDFRPRFKDGFIIHRSDQNFSFNYDCAGKFDVIPVTGSFILPDSMNDFAQPSSLDMEPAFLELGTAKTILAKPGMLPDGVQQKVKTPLFLFRARIHWEIRNGKESIHFEMDPEHTEVNPFQTVNDYLVQAFPDEKNSILADPIPEKEMEWATRL